VRHVSQSARVDAAFAAIDAANAEDPNRFEDQPLALVQGQRGSQWLDRLAAHPAPELQLSVRAHHLRRWEIVRADYPEGRQGYLAWRRANKQHQGESLASIMQADDWDADQIDRARTLLKRTKLRSDDDTQLLEDAACLVFLETQFDTMIAKTEHDHLVTIVLKTLRKMSSDAIELAGSIDLSPGASHVLSEAVAQLVASPA